MKIYADDTGIATRHADRAAGPVHISNPSDRVFLDTCTRQIFYQIEKLSSPRLGGAARIEAQEYLSGILVAYEEAAGQPWSPGGEIAA